MLFRLTLLVSLALYVSSISAVSYTLHHRIGSSVWSKRAVIQTDAASDATLDTPVAPQYSDLTGSAQPWTVLPGYESWSEEPYQLALTSQGMVVGETTPITFARVCHLATESNESITLHTDRKGGEVLGLSYELLGLDDSRLGANGCPTQSSSAKAKQVFVQVNKPQEPLTPLPPPPPPTKPDGTLLAPGEEPPKEQSFFRKYWYYILPVVLLMLIPTELSDANNDEAENAGADGMFQGGTLKSARAGGAPVGAASGNARKR